MFSDLAGHESHISGMSSAITYYKGGVRTDGAEIVPNDAPEIMNLLKELWATAFGSLPLRPRYVFRPGRSRVSYFGNEFSIMLVTASKGLVLGLAAIITYYKGGVRTDGAEIVPNDAPEIMNPANPGILFRSSPQINSAPNTPSVTFFVQPVAQSSFSRFIIWGEDLNKIPGLAEAVKANLDSIQEKGMLETVKRIRNCISRRQYKVSPTILLE